MDARGKKTDLDGTGLFSSEWEQTAQTVAYGTMRIMAELVLLAQWECWRHDQPN